MMLNPQGIQCSPGQPRDRPLVVRLVWGLPASMVNDSSHLAARCVLTEETGLMLA